MVYVPRGCAHAFFTLQEQTIFQYKVTAYYNKSSERGFRPDSPEIIKAFPELETKLQLSEKDRELPFSIKTQNYFHEKSLSIRKNRAAGPRIAGSYQRLAWVTIGFCWSRPARFYKH